MFKPLLATLAFAMSLSAYAADTPQAKVAVVSTQVLPDQPGKEVTILKVDYPPGATDPVHRHDAETFVYVLQGTVEMGVKGSAPVVLGPGQTFHEGPNDIHTVGRNASQTEPASFVVFMIKKHGAPILIPVK